MRYDFLIIGSGLYGATFAHLAKRRGYKVLLIDRRLQSGGNLFCENAGGVDVHCYGPHIFHTSSEKIWRFVNSIVPFRFHNHQVVALASDDKCYDLPINLATLSRVYGVYKMSDAMRAVKDDCVDVDPSNVEGWCIKHIGKRLFELLVRHYTEKQWGRPCDQLKARIVKRLPVRFVWDNNYYRTSSYVGLPIGGYNKLIEGLIDGCELRLGVDYFGDRTSYDGIANHVVYTGPLDQYFCLEHGRLDYRSLTFSSGNSDGYYQLNSCRRQEKWTRTVDYGMMGGGEPSNAIAEYPSEYVPGSEPYYPVSDAKNDSMADVYRQMASGLEKVTIGGRLGEYQYFDMDQTIASAMSTFSKICR